MQLPTMVTSDRMHTRKLARNTKVGLTSGRAFILVTVGIREVVVSSPATMVDSASVASVDIVAPAAAEEESPRFPRLRLGLL